MTPPHSVVQERQDDTASVRFDGELDVATAPALIDCASLALDGEPRLRLDLSGVTFIDSVGMKALLTIQQRAVRLGTDLEVVVSEEPVARLLRVATLDEVIRPVLATA